jgi:hypothetical protein
MPWNRRSRGSGVAVLAPVSRAALSYAALSCAALGCGSSSDAGDGSPDTSALLAGTVSCAGDERVDTYTANLDKAGELGVLSFRFCDLTPAPPA